MEIIKARIEQKKNIYIHNDLLQAANFFKQVIDHKIKADDRDALLFYQMACALMLAFAFEAKINFLGQKFLQNWREKQRFDDKVEQVLKRFGVALDWKIRPYSSIDELRRFRDLLAHGKPVETEHNKTVEGPADESDRRIDLSGEWEAACTPEKLTQASSDLDDIWKDLVERSGLNIWDTRTSGEGSITRDG